MLRNLPVKLTSHEVEEMLAAADLNRTGRITFNEFRRMMGV